MKMVMVVAPKKCGDEMINVLVNAGYSSTFHETRGGMLRQSQLTIFVAVKESEVSRLLELIRSACKTGGSIHYGFGLGEMPADDSQIPNRSGVVIFAWSLDRFELP